TTQEETMSQASFILRFGLSIACASALLLAGSLNHRASAQQGEQKSEEKKAEEKKEEIILKPAAKVSFTTDEGTWMSLDVSRDGQTIVFDLAGQIYTMPYNGGQGGEAKRIVGGNGDLSFNAQPQFSPDGQRIVFTSDRSGAEQLWVCKPDGS